MTMIRLPWPPAKSSANGSQGDYRGKARAGKAYKQECALECMAQRIPRNLTAVERVSITFYPPRNGKYDLDNHLGKLKRGLDAVSEHIGVDDADWQSMSLHRGKKVAGGSVVVVIE